MEKFIERFKGHWASYLCQFPFQWWVTVTYKDTSEGKLVKSEYAKVLLKTWIRKLILEEQLQIAYFGVLNQVNRIHLHVLMLGRNRHGKTLLDVSAAEWEKAWKAEAKIQLIYDDIGLSNYFERNMSFKNDSLSETILYNCKLLKKVENSKTDPNEMVYQPVPEAASVKSQMVEIIKNLEITK